MCENISTFKTSCTKERLTYSYLKVGFNLASGFEKDFYKYLQEYFDEYLDFFSVRNITVHGDNLPPPPADTSFHIIKWGNYRTVYEQKEFYFNAKQLGEFIMTGFHINKYTIWTFSSPCFLCKKNYLKSFNKSIVKYWDKI